jgi:hypothetical protein
MYCDQCGAQLTPGAQFCTSCGKAVIGARPPATLVNARWTEGRVRRHVHRLATLWLISGVLRLMGVGAFLLFGRMFLPTHWMGRGPWPMGPGWGYESLFSHGWFFPVGIFLGFFGLLHLALAWGLFERQHWARALGIVLGVLALFRLPFGTALGIYTLWVLAPENSAREYEQLSHPGGSSGPTLSPTASR